MTDAPPGLDVLGVLSLFIALAGFLISVVHGLYIVWRAFGWWSGPVYFVIGIAGFALALAVWLLIEWIKQRRFQQRVREAMGED